MLRTSARLLQEHFPRARCYRVGGDEFVALWHGVGDREFTAAAEELREAFGCGKAISGAVGAIWSDSTDRLLENISTADAQMYSAKKAYYRRQINPEIMERRLDDAVLALASEARVRHSLRHGEFRPRWVLRNEAPNHTFSSLLLEADFIQNGTTFDPGVFLGILEEAGHTHLLDRFLFFCACRRLASWQKENIPSVPIHMFLSTHTLHRPHVLRDMDRERMAMNVSTEYLRLHPLTKITDAAGRDGIALLQSLGYHVGDAPDPALPELDTFLAAGLKALNIDEGRAQSSVSSPCGQSAAAAAESLPHGRGARHSALLSALRSHSSAVIAGLFRSGAGLLYRAAARKVERFTFEKVNPEAAGTAPPARTGRKSAFSAKDRPYGVKRKAFHTEKALDGSSKKRPYFSTPIFF